MAGMYRRRPVAVLIIGSIILAACTTVPPEEDPVLIKLNDLDQRLIRIERVMNNDSLVGLLSDSQSMQTEIRELRGQVETLQYELEGAATRQRNLYLDVDERLATLETGSGVTTGATSGSGRSAAGSRVLPATAAGSGRVSELPGPTGTDTETYNAAFELLKSGQYENAATGFKHFLQSFPDSYWADNAQYWLAECYYVTRAFAEALAAFGTVVSSFPDSPKIPDAMLKLGYCQYELKDWGAAREALGRVRDDYPDTTAARLAEQRLGRMDNEGR